MCDKVFKEIMSHHHSARVNANLVTRTGNPEELEHGPIMTDETSYQMGCVSRESLAEEGKTMALRTIKFEHAAHRVIDEHQEELIDIEMLDRYVPNEESSGGPNRDYRTRRDVKKQEKDNHKPPIKFATISLVYGIVGETIDDAFTVGHDEQKDIMKLTVENIEGALIDSVQKSILAIIFVRSMYKTDKSIHLMDVPPQLVVSSSTLLC